MVEVSTPTPRHWSELDPTVYKESFKQPVIVRYTDYNESDDNWRRFIYERRSRLEHFDYYNSYLENKKELHKAENITIIPTFVLYEKGVSIGRVEGGDYDALYKMARTTLGIHIYPTMKLISKLQRMQSSQLFNKSIELSKMSRLSSFR